MILGDRLWPREELENWIRRHEGLNWRHRDGEDWIVKRLTTGRAESYLRVEEILDDFEELWRCIPSHIREGALREEEEHSEEPRDRQSRERRDNNQQDEEEEEEIEAEEVAGLTELLAHIDEEGDVTYGYANKGASSNREGPELIDIKVVELSPLGLPISTGDIWTCTRKDLTGITRWKGSVRGPACSSYPHPKLHTLEGYGRHSKKQTLTRHYHK